MTRIFLVPAGIALLTCIGLVSALTGDGLPDVISWGALAVPVAIAVWAMRTRRS